MALTPEQLAEAKAELTKGHALITIEEFNKLSADVALLRKREEDLAHAQKKMGELEEQIKTPTPSKKGDKDIEAILAEKEKEIRTQLQSQIDAITGKNKELAAAVAQKEVMSLFKSDEFIPEGLTWVKKAIGEESFLDDNGKIRFKGPNGQALWSRVKTNEYMEPEEYKGLILERFKDFVPSGTRSGDGDSKGQPSNSASGNKSFGDLTWASYEKMSPAEQDKVPVADLKRMAS